MRPLTYPKDADDDEDSIEVIRGWIIRGELHISIAPWAWKDQPEEWGRLLAEAAGHMADAISKETGSDRDIILSKIEDGLTANLEDPGDLSGEFRDPVQ
jgi:hypothetical protein